MAELGTRDLFEIKRDAERSRMELAHTVDQLRSSVIGARSRMAPDAIKARVSESMLEAARNNPAQAAAIAGFAAWSAMRIARTVPLPLALLGAGLYLTGSKSARDIAATAADEAARRTNDLRDMASDVADNASETLGAAAGRVADAAGRVAEEARSTAQSLCASAADAITGLTDTSEQVADRAAQWAGHVADQGVDLGASARRDLETNARRLGASAQETGRIAISRASDAMNWARENPAVIGGFGLVIGAFLGGAFPATKVERQVGGTIKEGMKAAAAAEMARAAGAVVRDVAGAMSTPKRAGEEKDINQATDRAAAPGENQGREGGVTGG